MERGFQSTENVVLVTIDQLLATGNGQNLASRGGVGFLKVDVQGRELAVLTGARQTILTHRPFILFEDTFSKRCTDASSRSATHGGPLLTEALGSSGNYTCRSLGMDCFCRTGVKSTFL